MYVCKTCLQEFETPGALGGHRRAHFPEKYRKTFEGTDDIRIKKRCLLEERGHKCEVCNTSIWLNRPIPIEIDHIDGNPENQAKENLRLICPNCHAQTSTYRGRNIGKVVNSKRAKTMKKYAGKYR